jgi:hypothetical protein
MSRSSSSGGKTEGRGDGAAFRGASATRSASTPSPLGGFGSGTYSNSTRSGLQTAM